MLILRRLIDTILNALDKSYLSIGGITLYLVVSFGILHYQMVWHKRDLVFWQQYFDITYAELQQYAILFLFVAVITKICSLLFVIISNMRTDYWNSEHTQLQLKKLYTEQIFKRLLVKLDEIERKHNFKRYEELPLATLIEAREEIRLAIEIFRMDVRKLLKPNQNEIRLPIEEVYQISDKDKYQIKLSKFNNLQIEADNDVLQYFVNPVEIVTK